MKIVYIDVSKLDSHKEKVEVANSFEKLGWTTAFHATPIKGLIPRVEIDYYQLTWDHNCNPVYPSVPEMCSISALKP